MGFLDNNGVSTLWGKIVGKSIPYGYCTTGASTRAKTVTVSPAITELTAGVQILVKFQYANTASTTSSAVTLNVNGLGAKDIKRYGSTNISNSAPTSWNANSVVLLTYDGTYWQLTDYNNTTYSSMSVAEYEAGTGTSARLITPARLKDAIQHWATGEANVQSDWEQTDSSADDFIKNKPTIPTVLEPLIGTSANITPSQVMSAIDEGRDIVIYHSGDIDGVDTDFTFTSWNRATDVDYSGAMLDVVVSDTIASLNGQFYLYELVGGTFQGTSLSWTILSTVLAKTSDIPTALSDLTNDVNYVQDANYQHTDNNYTTLDLNLVRNAIQTETDPTVPAWAKASTKPSYTATEVGALPDTTEIPEATTAINDSGYIYNGQTVDSKVSGVGMANATNLLTSRNDTYVALRANSTNPFLGLKCGSNLWYAQASGDYFYFGPTSVKAMRLDQDGKALFVDDVQANGDLTLYTPSGNSPGIIFQRGTLTDNYNDWKIYDKGGYLYFAQRGSGSADFNDMGYIDTTGVLHFTIPWGSVTGKPTFATVATSGSYNDLSDKPTIPSYSNATQSQAGLMSASDKQKLDALLVITQDSQTGEVTIGTGASQNQNGEVTI